MSINGLMTQLVDDLHEGGVPDPLAQRFTLAMVWDDLCRLAGETPPRAVRHLLDGAALLWDAPTWRPAATLSDGSATRPRQR
jgi:hypothetical protein